MPIAETDLIWMNGRLIPWKEATVHVLSHALHYGSSVFEGIRCYETHLGPRVFRLSDHIARMYHAARVYGMEIPFDAPTLVAAAKEVIRANNLTSAYVRPIAFKGYGGIGVIGGECPIDVAIAAFPWGAYLGEEGLKNGIDVCVSSWRRVAPGTLPAGLKMGGNYLSSQLISLEAKSRGFAEGIGLSHDGLVSEGAGENIFVVREGRLYTPPAAASILAGITRHTVITLAREMGLEVIEQPIPREMLYIADELFFTGTAAEVTPIRSVDRIPIGSGERPITRRLQEAFFGLFDGRTADRWGWLEPLEAEVATLPQAASRGE